MALISIGRSTGIPDVLLYPEQKDQLLVAFMETISAVVKHAPHIEIAGHARTEVGEDGLIKFRVDFDVT